MFARQDTSVGYELDSGPWEKLSAMLLPTADWTFETATGQLATADVVRVVFDLTGIPAATLEGDTGEGGGRIVIILISDVVEHQVQIKATQCRVEYRRCRTIRVEPTRISAEDTSNVRVKFG